MDRSRLQTARRDMQIIFQDPFESLNARHTIQEILEEPFLVGADEAGREGPPPAGRRGVAPLDVSAVLADGGAVAEIV